jgi:hypothetical protein
MDGTSFSSQGFLFFSLGTGYVVSGRFFIDLTPSTELDYQS